MAETTNKKFFHRFLDKVEYIGNKLPHPFMIFVYLAIFIIIVSAFISMFDVSVEHPGTGEEVAARSLFSGEGLLFMVESMLENFTGFAPLGLILVMMLGIGLAQRVGLFETAIKTTIMRAPTALVTYIIVFVGVLANIASDAAMVLVPPLGAMIFYSLGRNPIAGLCAGFAGAGAGFTANILIAGTDALLAGITTEAARAIDPDILVTPVDNWFFMSTSVFMIVIVIGLVTHKIIEPRLGKLDTRYTEEGVLEETAEESTKVEIRGLRNTVIAGLAYIALVVAVLLPDTSPLRGEGGTIIPSPFLSNIVPFIFILFIVISTAYGLTVGTIKKTGDVPAYMAEAVKDLASYIVLIFAIAQFIAYFEWTNLSIILAVNSSQFLQDIEFTGIGLFIAFIILATLLNQIITSGSAQWALMAPVFVPMFMLLGYDPAFAQLAYRIGDSSTQILTPLSPYVIMVLGFMKRYDSRAGLGTMISLMLPYSLIILAVWIVLFVIWWLLELPIGPGVGVILD